MMLKVGIEGHGCKAHYFNRQSFKRVMPWRCEKKEIYLPKYAQRVDDHLPGEKNGKKYGMRCDIVVNDVAETDLLNLVL